MAKTTKSFQYHRPIKAGTLSGILKRIAGHHRVTVDELLKLLSL